MKWIASRHPKFPFLLTLLTCISSQFLFPPRNIYGNPCSHLSFSLLQHSIETGACFIHLASKNTFEDEEIQEKKRKKKSSTIISVLKKSLPSYLNRFIRKLKPVLTLFSGIRSNQKTGCSASESLREDKSRASYRKIMGEGVSREGCYSRDGLGRRRR